MTNQIAMSNARMIKKTVKNSIRVLVASLALLGLSSIGYAVHPQNWTHQAESDYTDGQFDNVVVDNFGELALGRELKQIKAPDDIEFVNGFAQGKDGTIYFVTSSNGKVYKINDGKAEEFFTPSDNRADLLSIAVDTQGNLLVAACGDTAQLLRITMDAAGKPTSKVIFEDPKVEFIWAICSTADGATYLATGPHGQVWKVPADGKPAVALETKSKNVLALMDDGKGHLIAGTDGNGLVIRLDTKTEKAFVLLDAGTADVTALAKDEAGNIYATAGQPAQPHDEPATEDTGKPSKPGKVDPEAPDTSSVPEPVDEDNATKPQKLDNKNHANKTPGASGRITLPDNDILADNLPPDVIKALVARIKAKGQRDGTADPKQKPQRKKSGKDKGEPSPKNIAADEGATALEAGNIVYKIAADGTVTPLMHLQDMVVSLLYHDGEILVGSGNQGKLYASQPASETQALIARIHDENIVTLFQSHDGTVYVGTSNNGEVYTLLPHDAARGTYISPVLDATNAATFGAATLTANVPEGAKATIATRSGNVEDVENEGKFWNDWSDEIPANASKTIGSPAARFVQYRITLEANAQSATPVVAQTRLAYQVQNLPPVLKNLSVDSSGNAQNNGTPDDANATPNADAPSHTVHIYWDASDPNHDELEFRMLYRQVGTELWVQIAKDLKDPSYDWNTKEIPDGKYQIKVIASDAPDNTPQDAKAVARVTPIITINNTPPVLDDLKAAANTDKSVTLTGHAADSLSPITDVRYQVDGDKDWHPATASDKIFDSPSEGFSAVTRELAIGEHRVTVKAADAQGNVSYKAVMVVVK